MVGGFIISYLFHLPVRNIGMDMKNPPTAQARLTLDFWRYLLALVKERGVILSIWVDLGPIIGRMLYRMTGNKL